MIAQIRGRVVSASPRCLVDVGGVGFELLIPEKDREQLAPTESETRFYTYLYVREDRLNLFGFLSDIDRELFMRLVDVSGVGPKLALAALSLYPADRLVVAIRRGEAPVLQKVPGLGKKTAERLCIELSDKLDDITTMEPVTGGGPPSTIRDDVILALTSLGISRGSAEKTLEKMNWSEDDASVEDVVREALRYAGNI